MAYQVMKTLPDCTAVGVLGECLLTFAGLIPAKADWLVLLGMTL
jgi:hypothetical protein